MLQPDLDHSTSAPAFRDHLREAFQLLRAALTEALAVLGADPHRVRELARRLDVNKNLAWRVSRIVTAVAEVDAVSHVPGTVGFSTLLEALSRAGVPEAVVQRVRSAAAAYDSMVAIHSGDRGTLDQLAAGLTREPGAAERLEQCRRQAFQGLGSTWGVAAQVQYATAIIAPSAADADWRDMVTLRGLIGLRRLRGDARWTLFRSHRSLDDGSALPRVRSAPLATSLRTDGLPLLEEFSSPNVPELETVQVGKQTRWVLPSGPVGNTAALDCCFGELHRNALQSEPTSQEVEWRIGTALVTPVDRVQLDLIVSDDVLRSGEPAARLYNQLDGGSALLADEHANPRLPLLEEVHQLGRGLDTLSSAHVPRYSEMLRLAFERTGWDDTRFVGYRLLMRYPPIPTVLAFIVPLKDAALRRPAP